MSGAATSLHSELDQLEPDKIHVGLKPQLILDQKLCPLEKTLLQY